MTQKKRALMRRSSFASTTAKLWRLFFRPKSTLIRKYPPGWTSQKAWVIQACLYHPLNSLHAKCSMRCLLPKRTMSPGYTNYTREHHQEADHGTFHRSPVFTVSAALLQASYCGAQSSIRKTLDQISKFHAHRGYIFPWHHIVYSHVVGNIAQWNGRNIYKTKEEADQKNVMFGLTLKVWKVCAASTSVCDTELKPQHKWVWRHLGIVIPQ